MAKSDNVPRWLIGLILVFAGALATVGTISIATAATLSSHIDNQKTQFQDIKDRLVRIEAKLDALEK